MKNRTRTIALLLAVLMLCAPLFSCSESKTNTEEEPKSTPTAGADTPAPGAEETEPEESETMFMPDALPELNFQDETCRIFCWESWDTSEFFVEEDTGEIVDTAVFYRNLAVEERLGVKLEWDQRPRNSAAYGSDLKNAVQQQNASADNTYDAVACYGMRVASCATDGMLKNLHETTYIDLTKPWYYESAVKAGTLHKGYTYFIAGDISYNALARMSGVFFNTGMIANFQLEDPYELVLEGTWTIDKMHEMIKDTYADLDGDGKRSDADRYGIMIASDQCNTLYYGTGSHFIDFDEDGNPMISADVSSERTMSILEKYVSLFDEEAAYKNQKVDVTNNFDEGRILFYVYPLGHVAEDSLRESDIDYGFIPQPKVEASEEKYHASVTNAISLFAIPLVVSSEEKSSALIECLSSEGYRRVTPIVFEQAYKVKYNYDDSARQTKIFDMIRENALFDLGKIFCDELFGGFSNGVIATNIWEGNTNFASKLKGFQRVWQKGLEKLTKKLDFED